MLLLAILVLASVPPAFAGPKSKSGSIPTKEPRVEKPPLHVIVRGNLTCFDKPVEDARVQLKANNTRHYSADFVVATTATNKDGAFKIDIINQFILGFYPSVVINADCDEVCRAYRKDYDHHTFIGWDTVLDMGVMAVEEWIPTCKSSPNKIE